MPGGRIVVRGLVWVAKGAIGGSGIGLILFIPDAIALTDWIARRGFGVELCLERKASNALSDLGDFLFGWMRRPAAEAKWDRFRMVTTRNITMLMPPRGLQFVAEGDNLVLFTYEGRLFSAGVMELPMQPQSDACGTVRQDPQFVVWMQQASFDNYRPNLPAEIVTTIESRLGSMRDTALPPNQALEHYFKNVARMSGAQPAF